jgi:hypothetical protein
MNNEARRLLEQAASSYASMISYSDVGCVVQHLQPDDPVLRTDFSTLCSRPNLFRFEFSRPHPYPPLRHLVTRHVVGSDGFGAYALRQEYEMPPVFQARRDLSQAVSGVAGISSGSAHHIARLLLGVDGLSILDLTDARIIDDEEIDGAICHRISALLPRGGERKLSFERTSLLLRRIETRSGRLSSDELHRAIRVNPQLDDALFDIESPDLSGMLGHELHAAKFS